MLQYTFGLALGGEGGARIAACCGMAVSPDTLLRLTRRHSLDEFVPPRVLGVDDWAWRTGRAYRTILCDLERHCVIDLLPDREGDTLAEWLKQYPEIEIVTCDRSKTYAEAITRGAPQAIQVAVKNLQQVVREQLEPSRHQLRWEQSPPSAVDAKTRSNSLPTLRRNAERKRLRNRAKRLAQYQQMVTLRQQGLTIATVASRIDVSDRTVNRWLAAGQLPETD